MKPNSVRATAMADWLVQGRKRLDLNETLARYKVDGVIQRPRTSPCKPSTDSYLLRGRFVALNTVISNPACGAKVESTWSCVMSFGIVDGPLGPRGTLLTSQVPSRTGFDRSVYNSECYGCSTRNVTSLRSQLGKGLFLHRRKY